MTQYLDNTSKSFVNVPAEVAEVTPNAHSKVSEYGDRAQVLINAVAAGAFGTETVIPEGTLLSDTGAGYEIHDGVNTPTLVLDQPVNVAKLELDGAITTAYTTGKFNKAGLKEFDGTNFVAYTSTVAVPGALDLGEKLLLN